MSLAASCSGEIRCQSWTVSSWVYWWVFWLQAVWTLNSSVSHFIWMHRLSPVISTRIQWRIWTQQNKRNIQKHPQERQHLLTATSSARSCSGGSRCRPSMTTCWRYWSVWNDSTFNDRVVQIGIVRTRSLTTPAQIGYLVFLSLVAKSWWRPNVRGPVRHKCPAWPVRRWEQREPVWRWWGRGRWRRWLDHSQ